MTDNNEIIDNIKTQLYELYIDIKTFLISTEKENQNRGAHQEISSTSEPNILIDYLKNCIKILIDEKKNNSIEKNNFIDKQENNDIIKQFESYTKKLENDIKFFIKKQFTYKIQKDSLEMKIRGYMEIEEEYEELKEKVKYENGKFLNNDRKDNEIIILRRENSNLKKEISKIEEKTKKIEKKYNDDQDTIKGLKFKIIQLNKKIEEMKEELNNIKNKTNTINASNYDTLNLNSLNIKKNIIDTYNKTLEKNSMDQINMNGNSKTNMYLKSGLTNYESPTHNLIFESNKNNQFKSLNTNTIDNNKLIISTLNKMYNNNNNYNKNMMVPIRNNKFNNQKKTKSTSVSKRSDENEKSDLMNKYLSGNKSKFGPHSRIRSLNKINNRINGTGHKLLENNSNFNIKYIQREDKKPYEHSALNIAGINKGI